jgi:hypothetical protein
MRMLFAGLACLILTAGECPVDEAAMARRDLALHHAPIIYQDTNDRLPEGDYLTRFDYDGNQRADDNWDSFEEHRDGIAAFAYYSVVETEDHWYIVYGFFHPLDWSDGDDSEHENDLEGALAIVRRDDTEFGTLEAIITVFHLDFFTYTPSGTGGGREDVDGPLSFQRIDGVPHPVISIEAEGHGVKAYPFAGEFAGANDEDGVVFRPARSATIQEAVPSSGNDRDVIYTLVDFIPTLWSLQMGQVRTPRDEAETFASFGTLKGDSSGLCGLFRGCTPDAANAPWGWDDEDDGDVFAGELALDPAHVAAVYLAIAEEDTYVMNPYLTDLRDAGFGQGDEPAGWPEQLDIASLLAKAPSGSS